MKHSPLPFGKRNTRPFVKNNRVLGRGLIEARLVDAVWRPEAGRSDARKRLERGILEVDDSVHIILVPHCSGSVRLVRAKGAVEEVCAIAGMEAGVRLDVLLDVAP